MVQILPAFIFTSLFFAIAPGVFALPRPIATRQITAFHPIGTKQPIFPNPGIALDTRQNQNGGGSPSGKDPNGGGSADGKDPSGGASGGKDENGGGASGGQDQNGGGASSGKDEKGGGASGGQAQSGA